MKLQTIEERWNEFAARVLKDEPVTTERYIQTKRAFWAGSWSMISDVRSSMDVIDRTIAAEEEAAILRMLNWIADCCADGKAFFLEEIANRNRRN